MGDSQASSKVQKSGQLGQDLAATAHDDHQDNAALSNRVDNTHEHSRRTTRAGRFLPGSHEYQEALSGASENPRGYKSMEQWLREWEGTWEDISKTGGTSG